MRKIIFHRAERLFCRLRDTSELFIKVGAKALILLLAYFLPVHIAFCQQPIENHFTHYTAKDGLAEGEISSIVQDSTGFLWIGTQNGLCRFDGHTFKTYRYNLSDTNSIRENRIISLFIDSKKRLWAMSFHWLYLYHPDGEWFEHFNINSLTPDMLLRLCAEENGQLIIGGHNTLYKFDIKQKRFSLFYHEGIMPQHFNDYKKDEEGIEWIGADSGLIRYDPRTKKSLVIDAVRPRPNKGQCVATSVILLDNGYLLASTSDNGLILVNRKTNTVKEFHTHEINPEAPLKSVIPFSPLYNRTDCLYKLNDSIILCSCSGGLSTFNWRRQTFTYFKPDRLDPASLLESDVRIFSIFKDREGIIWLGGQYLEKYDFKDYNAKIFPKYRAEQQADQFAPYYDLYRCADGKFLLGGYAGMSIYDTSTDILINYEDKNDPYKINYFSEDGRGNIWCYAQRCVRVFSIKNGRAANIKQYKIPGNFTGIYDLTLDHKGRVLVATSGNGLVVFDTLAKTFSFFNAGSAAPSQFSSSVATSICEDHNGCLWVGTERGINKIDKDGITVMQYGPGKKNGGLLSDWFVNGIKEDRHGIIWFTTNEHGIGRIDPGNDSVRFFSIAQGLPTCWFNELCIDGEDNLWAVSEMGILNLNVVTLQNKLYTEEEGFPLPDDISTIHYSRYTKKLYILTPGSIFEIDSKNTNHNNKIPQTSITGFSVFNKEMPVASNKQVSLQYNENFINIQFACLLFHSNRQIKYAYKMEGIDEDWVYCNYTRHASYTNLPPGYYIFKVKAQSPDGVWDSTPTQLSIEIRPPFWQTWWFYLLEFIGIIVFVIWVVRLYTARKLAKQKNEFEKLRAVTDERKRIASDMHDDLGAGLTSIRLLSEVANMKTIMGSPAKPEIEKIVKYAEHLSENLREIIWAMNTRFDKLDDFIIYIRSYAVGFFDDVPIYFQFNKPAVIPELVMHGELRRNIFLCIKEALHNVVKHSKATEASLTFDIIGNELFVEVKDNGVGFDINQTSKYGNGLNTMKERLDKFGGSLEIKVNNGTSVCFKIRI